MQEIWIKRGHAEGVVLLALGWAGSEEMVEHLDCGPYDLVCLYDYRDMQISAELISALASYRVRHLIGWSFGVWAASSIFAKYPSMVWSSATALGGTPCPVDSQYGIPPRSFGITARGIETLGTARFLERMCGRELRSYMIHRSRRPLDEICEELWMLGTCSAESMTPAFRWSRAVVGSEDLIFPPAAMMAYWHSVGVPCDICEGAPHYPFADKDILLKLTR